MLRGAGLGALRAILTQINQTAAVGPGRRRASGLQGVNLESRELVQLVRVGDSDVLGEGG